jgi:hypothetical protein
MVLLSADEDELPIVVVSPSSSAQRGQIADSEDELFQNGQSDREDELFQSGQTADSEDELFQNGQSDRGDEVFQSGQTTTTTTTWWCGLSEDEVEHFPIVVSSPSPYAQRGQIADSEDELFQNGQSDREDELFQNGQSDSEDDRSTIVYSENELFQNEQCDSDDELFQSGETAENEDELFQNGRSDSENGKLAPSVVSFAPLLSYIYTLSLYMLECAPMVLRSTDEDEDPIALGSPSSSTQRGQTTDSEDELFQNGQSDSENGNLAPSFVSFAPLLSYTLSMCYNVQRLHHHPHPHPHPPHLHHPHHRHHPHHHHHRRHRPRRYKSEALPRSATGTRTKIRMDNRQSWGSSHRKGRNRGAQKKMKKTMMIKGGVR